MGRQSPQAPGRAHGELRHLTSGGPAGENRPVPHRGLLMTASRRRQTARRRNRPASGRALSRRQLLARLPTPLELLVATILSAQCTDVRVNLVTKTLFRKYPTAAHYARAKPDRIGTATSRARAFFATRPRASRIAAAPCSSSMTDKCPRIWTSWWSCPAWGEKRPTSSWARPSASPSAWSSIRTSPASARRLGLTCEKDPEKIETDLMDQFARKEWIALSHRLIQHGRRLCTARSPKCEQCPLESVCPKIGVGRKLH